MVIKRFFFFALFICVFFSSQAYDFVVDGIYYNVINAADRTVSVTYNNTNKYTGDIKIPDSIFQHERFFKVTELGYASFRDCKLTSLVLPHTIKKINSDALSKLKVPYLLIPSSVEWLVESYSLDSISNLTFEEGDNELYCDFHSPGMSPDSLIIYRNLTRGYFNNLLQLTPQNYLLIGCDSLKSLKCFCPNIIEVTQGATIKSRFIDPYLTKNPIIKSVIIDRNIITKTLVDDVWVNSYSFFGGYKIKNLIIGPNADTIISGYGNGAYEIYSIDTLDLSPNIKHISPLSALEIYCRAIEPPTVTNDFLTGIYINSKVYVPEESLEKYKNADKWKNFFYILPIEKSNHALSLNHTVKNATFIISNNTVHLDKPSDCQVYDLSGRMQMATHSDNIILPGPGIWVVVINGESHKIKI